MKLKDRDGAGKFKKGYAHPKKRKDINLELLKKRYFEDKKSTYDIGKEMGVSQKTIENRLKENGSVLRNYKERAKCCNYKTIKTQFKKGYKPSWAGTKGIRKKTKGSFKKGSTSWNKGLIGVQESTKKGKTFEEFYGNERAEKIIEKIKEKRKYQITPVKDTTIEVKIQDFLKKLGIEFFTHQYMKIKHGYQCDILVPKQEGVSKKTIIECFGDYWHNYPYAREIDIKRCNELREKGYRVLVFWEREIRQMPINVIGGKLAR